MSHARLLLLTLTTPALLLCAAPTGGRAEPAPATPMSMPADPVAPESAIPYDWSSVAIGGGGFVSGLLFHPAQPGLRYARTDVGGAYRWDEAEGHWTAITDFLGMDQVNLTGIESFAVDPHDASRIYLAAGTYTAPHIGNGALLVSTDRGHHFTIVNLPFKCGGNEASRGNGERLAVDPNQGAILLLGTRAAGLWRSSDHAASWTRVDSFPSIATSEDARDDSRWKQPLGIVFVLFDPSSARKGEATPVVYAGVSTRKAWLYRSTDGGRSWTEVPGQPLGLRPTRPSRASDGTLFFSLGDSPGPNTMTDGAVWKLDPRTDTWTNITPRDPKSEKPSYGYGAVCVDPSDPRRLLVSTFCRYAPNRDLIFRSTDGGHTWRDLFAHSRFTHDRNPWAAQHTPHWMADLRIDPFNPSQALFVTGYGVYRTRGLLASDADPESDLVWEFDNAGLEETVPLGLVSPPEGAHLLSALGDIDGFRHENLDTPGQTFAAPPRFANSESIDFAGLRPALLARSGTIRQRTTEVRGAWSSDGGLTWRALASEPPDSNGAGVVAVAADGAVLVWTPRGLPPAGATGMALWRPYPGRAHRSTDLGATWQPCAGLPGGVNVVADRADPLRFYAYEAATGRCFTSTDGAANFIECASGLPSLPPVEGGFGGGMREAGHLRPVPGSPGELWLETRSDGLHHSTDAGAHWTHLPHVEQAYSLGFGKAPKQGAPATLFLAGQIAGAKGVFRSTDNGATWQRIDDDLHRFGWINHVTGDPRIFGRVYFATSGRGIMRGDPR